MKKITALMTFVALLGSNAAFADCQNDKKMNDKKYEQPKERMKEKAKEKECPCPCKEFAWGIGLCGLAVVGVVAGLTASMASGSH
jgi:hypothetical protein